MTENLYIEGLDELVEALEAFPRTMQGDMETGMRGAAGMVRQGVAEYPPSSAANAPPGIDGYSWYERGFGTKTVTGRSYPTSEALGRSWTDEVKREGPRTVKGVVGTKASYADYVQGEAQVDFHRARGWRTVQQVVEEMAGDLEEYFGRLVNSVLSRLSGRGR